MENQSYKTLQWCRTQFIALLAGDGKARGVGNLPLRNIAERFPGEWSDFCVLEGIVKDPWTR